MTAPKGRNGIGKYRIRQGHKHEAPSVTSVVGLLDKPGLPWGAARETALFAIHHQQEWMGLPEEEAYERLRKHHRGVWTAKADTGSVVHDVALAWSKGEAIDVAEMVRVDDKDRERQWTGGPEIPFQRVQGCLGALEAFYAEHRPEWLATEQTVFHTGTAKPDKVEPTLCYAGSFDAKAKLADGAVWRLDWKTGSRYPIETTLQLAAYEGAPWVGEYGDDGELLAVSENEATDRQGVVYLHDDGTFELLELPVIQSDAHGRFMELRAMKAWLDEMKAWEKKHPEPVRQNQEKEDDQ